MKGIIDDSMYDIISVGIFRWYDYIEPLEYSRIGERIGYATHSKVDSIVVYYIGWF